MVARAVAAFVVAATSLAACTPSAVSDVAAVVTTPNAALPQSRTASQGWAVSNVVDGDTLDVTRGTNRLTVRLVGINTPESGECLSAQATSTLRALVQDGPLTLRRDVSDIDIYGRALRYVINAQGRDVGARLVKRGLALSRRYPPDTARADRYDRLQARARAARRGLWAPDACGPATGAELQVSLIRADALGDDNKNLNDEWVQFTNVGRTTIDMTGWEIADESASNRYRFGTFRLAPGASFTLFSGCGTNTASSLHWCRSSAVWNNDGDTVFVRDRNGSTVVSESYRG
jgi:micrococcal nuclease